MASIFLWALSSVLPRSNANGCRCGCKDVRSSRGSAVSTRLRKPNGVFLGDMALAFVAGQERAGCFSQPSAPKGSMQTMVHHTLLELARIAQRAELLPGRRQPSFAPR